MNTKENHLEEELLVQSIKITSPNKLLFKKSKITKLDLVLYYQKMAPRMLEFLNNRIISTVRCPDGVCKSCFYKKHLNIKNMGRINLPNKSGLKEDYYFIKDISGIISEVQLNAIEFHIWGSKVEALDKPDMIIFDLDPDESLTLKEVRDGIKDLKLILDKMKLKSFLKTSGGKGYHVVLPLQASTWDKTRDFSKSVAELMTEKWPDKYTANMKKENRKGKIFIDWMRNIKGATSVAPYSVRAKDKGAVSMPIKWSELDKIAPDDITMEEAVRRLKLKDPWLDFTKFKNHLK